MNVSKFRKGIEPREGLDFYATDPSSVKKFMEYYTKIKGYELENLTCLEPCAGNLHMSNILKGYFKEVNTYDIIERDFKLDKIISILDLTTNDIKDFDYIITNPPFKIINQIIKHMVDIMRDKQRFITLAPISILESKARYEIFKDNPPKHIYINTGRVNCAKNGDFVKYPNNSSQVYIWVLFEKGFKGTTSLHFIPYTLEL